MSTHKTADLTGPLLDAAVALAEGLHPYNFRNKWCLIVDKNEDETVVYEPSVDWERGGQIMERERIAAEFMSSGKWTAQLRNEAGYYVREPSPSVYPAVGRGPTPLVAAMRAYVASKFGDEVELP